MTDTLVDSSVLIDLLAASSSWRDWSAAAVEEARQRGDVWINPIVLAEVSASFATSAAVDQALPPHFFRRDPLPFEAAFAAGKAYLDYRRRGGQRSAPLPDFYIGAHAAWRGYRLLTRDRGYYQTYFPSLVVISPGSAP